MKSFYSVQTSENSSISIPMIGALTPEQALLLGALVAQKNSNLVNLMANRGSILLGCLIGSMLEGENFNLEADEAVSLTKMLVSDVVSLLFDAFETLEKSLDDAGLGNDLELKAQEEPTEAIEVCEPDPAKSRDLEAEEYLEAIPQVIGDDVINSIEYEPEALEEETHEDDD